MRKIVQRIKTSGTAGPAPGAAAYERQKFRAAQRARKDSAEGRDIGPLPPVKDPERRRACEKNLQLSLETYWRKSFYRPWSDSQLITIKRAEIVVLVGALFALALARGEGKTTICRHTVQWAVNNAHARFPFLINAKDETAKESLAVIQMDYETNETLAEDFPELCFPIWKLDGIRNRAAGQLLAGVRTRIKFDKRKLVLPTVAGSPSSGSVIKCGGLLSAMRGANHRLADGTIIRPDLIVLDDPQTRESAESPPQTATRVRIVTADALGMGGAGAKLAALMPCTVIAPGDLADTVLDINKHPEWRGLRTALVTSFPERMDLWSEYWDIFTAELRRVTLQAADSKEAWFVPPKATAFYRGRREEMDRGGKVSNPYRKREDELSALQHAMNLYLKDEFAFFSEYQNQPKDPKSDEEFLTAAEIARKVNQYSRGQVPLGVAWLTFSMDCHKRAITWQVCGFEPDFTGFGIDYGIYPEQNSPNWRMARARPTLAEQFPGAGDEGALHQGIGAVVSMLMGKSWIREDGVRMELERGMADQNYLPEVVQRAIREHGHVRLVIPAFGKEIGPGMIPMAQYRKRAGEQLGQNWIIRQGRSKGMRSLQFDTGYWKTFVARRLATPIGSPGSFTLFGREPKSRQMPERPANHDLLSRHLDSETRTVVTDGDHACDIWRPKPGGETHWLDDLVHCHILASICGAKTGAGRQMQGAITRLKRSLAERRAAKRQQQRRRQWRNDDEEAA